jgi:hypothetical protein
VLLPLLWTRGDRIKAMLVGPSKRVFLTLAFTLLAAAACSDPTPSTNANDASPSVAAQLRAQPAPTSVRSPTPSPAAPAVAAPVAAPAAAQEPYAAAKAAGATAVCADGTLSFSQNRSGTCSHHGGVHWWTGNLGPAGPGAH